jgi:uncharacterized protein (DUF169 family)
MTTETNPLVVAANEIEKYLRLRTFPVGFKFVHRKEDLKNIKRLRMHEGTLCQAITASRTFGWTLGAVAENIMTICAGIFGLAESPEKVKDGTLRQLAWCKTREDAKKFEDSIPRIPLGQCEAIVIGALSGGLFEPDLVLFYGNPAQMIFMINALQYEDYERLQFYCVGESSCSDTIVQCFLSGKPALSVPCFGERRYGHAQDDELAIAVPCGQVEKVNRNLGELYKKGIRYPIPYWGNQCDPVKGGGVPPAYMEIFKEK